MRKFKGKRLIQLPEERNSSSYRLRSIIKELLLLFDGEEIPYEHLSVWHRLELLFKVDDYPIYKRMRKNGSLKVEGFFWISDLQHSQFTWNGFHGAKKRIFNGVETYHITKTLQSGWWFIRERGEWIDIEAQTITRARDKKASPVREYITCTIHRTDYNNLIDKELGPVVECCTIHHQGRSDDESDY